MRQNEHLRFVRKIMGDFTFSFEDIPFESENSVQRPKIIYANQRKDTAKMGSSIRDRVLK